MTNLSFLLFFKRYMRKHVTGTIWQLIKGVVMKINNYLDF